MIKWRGGEPDRAFSLAYYARHASQYDASARRIESKRARAIEWLGVAEGETVLDVACGTGAALPLLSTRAGRAGRVIGVEQSPQMMQQARDRVALLRLGNVELIESSVEAARIPGPLDAVLFCYTHDVLRSPTALANIFRSAPPGARVVTIGAKLHPRWLAPLNLWVKWRTWGYLSTVQGLEAPWTLLARFCPDLAMRETMFLGSGYIASGTYSAAQPPRA